MRSTRTLGTYYLLTARNYEKAIENYQTLLRLYPADTAGHGNLGMAYMLMGHPDLAANEAREALKIYPRNLKQRYNLALYQMYAGDFDKAIRDGSAIIEETPSYAIGYYPVALSMIATGDVAGAQKIYARLEAQGAVGAGLARLGRIDHGDVSGAVSGGRSAGRRRARRGSEDARTSPRRRNTTSTRPRSPPR